MDINPLTQIDWRVIVAMIVIVTLTYFGLRRFFVMPYLGVMLERDRLVDDAHLSEEHDAETLAAAEAEAAHLTEEAQQAARDLITEARSRAEAYHAEALAAATGSASTRLEEGRRRIEERRAAESGTLREHAVECVGIACGRLDAPADVRSVAQAVDEVLARTQEVTR